MTAALVDDSPEDLDILFQHICHYCHEHKVHMHIEKFTDEALFLKAARHTAFNLVFLDIYLRRTTGIHIAEKLKKQAPDCQIIFVTASEKYAVKAFRLHALDYLVKPCTYSLISDAMNRFDQTAAKLSHYIELKEGRHITRVLISDILYVDYHNHYVQVHTVSGTIRSQLYFKDFSPMLDPYPQFLRCRRNCMVNMDFIDAFDNKSFLLNNGKRISISRSEGKEIIWTYTRYLLSPDKESITL